MQRSLRDGEHQLMELPDRVLLFELTDAIPTDRAADRPQIVERMRRELAGGIGESDPSATSELHLDQMRRHLEALGYVESSETE